MKIIDKLNEHIRRKEPFFSFEFFPPKTEAGVHNLFTRIRRMAELGPAFIDVTWGAGGSTKDTTIDIASKAQNVRHGATLPLGSLRPVLARAHDHARLTSACVVPSSVAST